MIVDLARLGTRDIALAGGKAANLGELMAARLPVPDGFCVTVDAYRAVVAPLWPRVEELLAGARYAEIRELIATAALPEGLASQIGKAVDRLGGPVAVRSSATAEDLPEASFAGQQDTFLGVVGATAVTEAVRRCWASLWTDRAIAYRAEHGYAHRDVALAVVVQTMVAARSAGVAFTADPVTGKAEITIESAWGLGESVVSGAVTPDSFTVRGRRVEARLGDKRTRIDLAPNGSTRTVTVGAAGRTRYSLTRAEVMGLARLARRVEAHYGRPMDIEWAIADSRAWLLQARPITAIVQAEGRAWWLSRFIRTDIVEHFPAPFPLDLAMAEAAYRALRAAGSVAGIGIWPERGLITLDDDGVARVRTPRVTVWGVPAGIGRVLRARWTDPRTWESAHGARARQLAGRVAELDVVSLSGAELLRALKGLLGQAECLARARFAEYLGFHLARGGLIDVLLRLARVEATQFDLLGGLDYATAIIDRRLRGLAASAPSTVLELLGRESIDADAVRAADPAWWGEVEAFLADYGARTPKMYLPFSNAGWREDLPGFLGMLAVVARGDAEPAPSALHGQIVARAVARLPRRLGKTLTRLVDDYRAGHVMREASVVELEELGAAARRLALEAGQRMVGVGLCSEAGDVKYLSLDELGHWLNGEPVDVAGIVERRRDARPKAEAAWHETGEVSPSVGGGLTGVAASPGSVTSEARVITGASDFARLQRGDVLVCRATDPAWTPLFALAGAVVAETGGRLSHAAIVAREYRIPAVLGVAGATSRIADGQRIMVDGSRGVVEADEVGV